jgi:myo-inositol-1-phosphate synthase
MSIRIAIAGAGNCASSLVQGIHYYRREPNADGLMHAEVGGYRVGDLHIVAAFDVDARKVGRPLNEAIFALPNNTKRFADVPADEAVVVEMGPILDGIAPHLAAYPADHRFIAADRPAVDVAAALRLTKADVLVNYMPVGAQAASEHYARACLDAGVAFVNCVPCFIVSDAKWARQFVDRRLPCVGDDIKAQVGATIVHRTLARLFDDRGVEIDGTYQLNTGGNTDFLNMLARDRLSSKKESKTQAVQSQLDVPLDVDRIHVGPSDYVPWLRDNKVCFLRLEGRGFGGVGMNLELRLSVEDSPNSAGAAVDAIRAAKVALDRGIGGAIDAACAWTMKHPPAQMRDDAALAAFRQFVGSDASGSGLK